MRILQLAPLVESVPPVKYGGTELVVALLADELVAQGHDVTLIASGDSRTKAHLEPITSKALRLSSNIHPHEWVMYEYQACLRAKELAAHFDIIHNHMGFQAFPFLDGIETPVVTTNHNCIAPSVEPVYRAYAHLGFVAISQAYRRINLESAINYVATVYNGIDYAKYAASFKDSNKRDYLLFIGRFSPDKGPVAAIEIATQLGIPLKMAGKVDAVDRRYYKEHVEPLMSRKGIELIGEVNEAQKIKLFSGAIATVYPVAFDEPFGLVIAESLASGTPVMAFDRGSIRELLKDGQTAIIGNKTADLVERFDELLQLDGRACIKSVADKFSKRAMAEGYLRVYQQEIEKRAQCLANEARSIAPPTRAH